MNSEKVLDDIESRIEARKVLDRALAAQQDNKRIIEVQATFSVLNNFQYLAGELGGVRADRHDSILVKPATDGFEHFG
jgi:hypothetical protein